MPELPVTRRQALLIALALGAVLVLAAKLLVPAGAASSAAPLAVGGAVRAGPAPALVVHVVGAVRAPGLYRLPRDARVDDAVRRAGGATGKANLALVNLAAPVSDGQQVVVPERVPPAAAAGSSGEGGSPADRVHLNSATLEQLDALPGVGPVTAQKIVDYREAHGAFSSVDDLDAIPGIGPARLEQLRELVVP